MKNQYFGDINDYRKYGLLRAIRHCTGLRLLVAWMLTPDDGSTDGQFVNYLAHPSQWERHDPDLYWGLKGLLDSGLTREVALIERSNLIPGAGYFSEIVPAQGADRRHWFASLQGHSAPYDFVFLDPDNGLEVKSTPYGRRNSSKFLYWREVEALWSSGRSLLIYQHFIREKRSAFVRRMLESLEIRTPGSLVEAFSTPNVVFLMALQPAHHHYHIGVVESVQEGWEGQISHWELTRDQQGVR